MKEIDTLKHVQDSASLSMIMDDVHSGKSSTGEYYFIITLILIIVAVFLLYRYFHSKHYLLKQKLMNEDVDFSHIIDNAFLSKNLYDMLKVKCHPDCFASYPNLQPKATEIFANIVNNKYNY